MMMERRIRQPYERKLKLLRYLKEKPSKRNLAITTALLVIQMNTKAGLPFLREMEREGLIEIHKSKSKFVNILTITEKGLVVADMLTQFVKMGSKRGEFLR